MSPEFEHKILELTGASSIGNVEFVQSLWSGFGAIERVNLHEGDIRSVIVKRIQQPDEINHPRGWNSDVSAERKLRSYQIEQNWYKQYASIVPASIRMPKFLFDYHVNGVQYLVLEDLYQADFPQSYDNEVEECLSLCVNWLAELHAMFLGHNGDNLWEIGTYWQLETRHEEFDKMPGSPLKNNAWKIHEKLRNAEFQTIVHGDAKPANFCFSEGFNGVAALDFQYIGRGCGMRDLVYLMSSAMSESELIEKSDFVVDQYFWSLKAALQKYQPEFSQFEGLQKEWTELYPFAWADFVRFLRGWSPDNRRLNDFAAQKAIECLQLL